MYTLRDHNNQPVPSDHPGTVGGHRKLKIYGRLDCSSAQRWLARGHYKQFRVFFADEATAIAAGYRPCGNCMPTAYKAWRAKMANKPAKKRG